MIKRVAFLPGDRIQQVNAGDGWYDLFGVVPGRRKTPMLKWRIKTVLPGEAYVLGDNRVNSLDSSTFGPVDISNIWGEVLDQRSRTPNELENMKLWKGM
jgi:type IV secretory pathway protease TraF